MTVKAKEHLYNSTRLLMYIHTLVSMTCINAKTMCTNDTHYTNSDRKAVELV